MYTLLVVTHVLVSVALIGLVLIQHGKGADAGAAFGSGASGTVFGSRGSANFLSRMTAWLAGAFFVLSLALAYIVHGRSGGSGSVVDALPAAAAPAAPDAKASDAAASKVATPEPPTGDATKAAGPAPAPAPADAAPETPKPKVPE